MSQWTLDGCPSEDDIAAFVADALPADERGAFEDHLDACRGCRGVVADMVRVFDSKVSAALPEGAATPGSNGDPQRIETGTTVGRYRILEVLGMGGMGIVYAAFDPQLERKVALKVLRSHRDEDDGFSTRLLREAQAMARLSHPNVIAVHDVGTWHGRVFVAMEFVQGGTLEAWLEDKPRTWSAVWPTLLAAGRGLAAAHEAGFVHRDFKPDNVLVSESGRVFVTDFGLVRWAEADTLRPEGAPVPEEATQSAPLDSVTEPARLDVLTKTGSFVGTPAYMAPEQFRREPVDAACDQFAYCVVLWEALLGERPFRGRTLAALSAEVCEAPVPPFPTGTKVPRNVRAALVRGLAKHPQERHPSMAALLETLAPPRRAWVPWVSAGAAFAIGVPIAAMATHPQEPPSAISRCQRLEGLGEAWNDTRRSRVERALLEPGTPFAQEASARVTQALERFATDFVTAEEELCEASEAGTLDPTRAALRRRCLDERREGFSDIVTALESADARMAERAVRVSSTLASPTGCDDDARLQADVLPPPPPAILTEVESKRRTLRSIEAQRSLGQYDQALARIEGERASIEALAFRPLSAEFHTLRGRLLLRLGKYEAAAAALEQAQLDATASRHVQVSAVASVLRISALGRAEAPWSQVESAIARSQASLEAANPTPKQRASRHTAAAVAASQQGRGERAIEEYERALDILDAEREPLEWARASLQIASEKRRRGGVESALPVIRQAIEVYTRELGPTHPDLIEPHRELGVALKMLERFDEARTALQRALEITAASRGESSFVYGGMLSSLSGVEGESGNLLEALELAQRSAAVLEAAGQSTLIPDAQQAEWLTRLHRPDEAVPIIDAILQAQTKRLGPDSPGLSWIYFVRAAAEAARKDVDATREACDRAIELASPEPGSDDALTLQLDRAVHLANAGGSAEALESLQPARDVLTTAPASPTTARVYRELALREWDAGHEDRARADMRRAAAQFNALELAETAAAVDAWLSTHGA